jgi:hypothetical protein
MRRVLASVAITTLVAPVGCETEEPTEMIFPDQRSVFAESLAAIVCARAESCCDGSGHAEPSDICFSSMRNDTYVVMLVADDEKIELELDGAGACLDRFRAEVGCDGSLLAESLPTLCPELFGDIPSGTEPAGAACEHTYECASPPEGDRACLQTAGGAGQCIWFVPAAAGEPCAMDPDVVRTCPDGMGCRPTTDTEAPSCQPLGGYGDVCFAWDSCGDGLVCSVDLDGTLSCADLLGLDDLCDERPDACAPSMYCQPGSNKCRPLPVVEACADPACPDYALQKVCR